MNHNNNNNNLSSSKSTTKQLRQQSKDVNKLNSFVHSFVRLFVFLLVLLSFTSRVSCLLDLWILSLISIVTFLVHNIRLIETNANAKAMDISNGSMQFDIRSPLLRTKLLRISKSVTITNTNIIISVFVWAILEKLLYAFDKISKGNESSKRQHLIESVIEIWCKGNKEVYSHLTIIIFSVCVCEREREKRLFSQDQQLTQHPTLLNSKKFQHFIHTFRLNSEC